MSQGMNRRQWAVLGWSLSVALVMAAAGFLQQRGQQVSAASAANAGKLVVAEPSVQAESSIAAGRYLVRVGGCNDCHSVAGQKGQEPTESEALTGSPVGFRGPWGTTYPSNLRLFVKDWKEDDFVAMVRARNSRPPMPWASLHAMSDADLRAVFRYIKSLPVTGKLTPEYVPPTEEPKTPFVSFMPVMPKGVEGK